VTHDRSAAENNDCDLVARLWNLLESPASGEWYLGSIIKNGLKDPELGIDIPPFPTVAVGDIPEQTMFEWALEHLAISMQATTLSGLDTYSGGKLLCTPVSATETDVQLTLDFAAVSYTGGYDVGASGVTGCAIATASTLLGGPSGATEGPDSRLALAAWYRDDPHALAGSSNGQLSVGTYYLHEDTIQAVTTANNQASKLYRDVLAKQRTTADAVTTSTRYWQEQQTGKQPPGPPPKIGATGQSKGGYQTYVYLNLAVQSMREQAGLPLEPGNEYAELQNAMAHFNAQVKAYQHENPGEHDTAEIMYYVANADPVAAEELDGLGFAGIPVHDRDSGEIVDHVAPWPLDRERALRAYSARAPRPQTPADWFHVKGSFSDRAQTLSASFTVKFESSDGEKLFATALATKIEIGSLAITLGNESGWNSQPGLYERVATWIANTQSFQDTLKSKLNAGLNSQSSLARVTDALNAGLKKLGLQ
jgi:hypothetical protein